MFHRRSLLAATAVLGIGIAGVALLSAAPGQMGQVGLVTTTDGRTFEGQVSDNGGTITVNVRGVATTLQKVDVLSIDYASFAERFRDRLASLADDDIKGRLDLAREALDRKEYDLSFSAIDAAMAIDPLDREARRLSLVVQRQVQLDQASTRAAAAATEPATPLDPTDMVEEPMPPNAKSRLLTLAQVNRLRQLELQPGDRVRVRFLNNVRRRFADSQAGVDIRAFIRRDETDQAIQILTQGTREMRDDVQIISDPGAIQSFARYVHVPILQGCATSACHGGDNAGDFRLINGPRMNQQTMLTNFFLIASYRGTPKQAASDAGAGDRPFGGGAVDMVERTKGDRSLLYQYALPRQLAAIKHPPIRGWDGIVRNGNDRLARDLIQWMDVDLASVRPDYREIDFRLGSVRRGDETMTATQAPTPSTEQSSDSATEPAR